MLIDTRAAVTPDATFIAANEEANTLVEQIIQLSGYGHGSIPKAQPTDKIIHNVRVDHEKYKVIDHGYDMENGFCTMQILHGKNQMDSIRINMHSEDYLELHPPTTEEALDLMSVLISQGDWSKPELKK